MPEKQKSKVVFKRVAENLYRLETSGGYYALLKRADKQFRRSLRTKDRKLAERRLAELRSQVGSLTTSDDARLGFPEIADRWMAATSHTLKEASIKRRRSCIKNLTPFFAGMAIRNIQAQHCERWLTERAGGIAAQTMAHELNTMRGVFDYAVKHGLMLANPAKDIQRKRIVQKAITIPTREQFKQLIATIRQSDGRLDSQRKAKAGADMVELLAYSGMRVHEARELRWRDVNFEKNNFIVTGGERGTKNHEQRLVPMNSALRNLLENLERAHVGEIDDYVSPIKDAKKCIQTAARRLQIHPFTHHDFRHFFATTCIESGVDIPTVSRWLGHRDGGALAMRVYGHLRVGHSNKSAQLVNF